MLNKSPLKNDAPVRKEQKKIDSLLALTEPMVREKEYWNKIPLEITIFVCSFQAAFLNV